MSYFDELASQYIDGEWRQGAGSWDLIDVNPYDGGKLAAITVATAAEVDQAYRAAERAQRDWAEQSPYARRLVFERAVRIVEELEERIARTIIAEVGGTHRSAAYELFLTKDMLREAMSYALRPEGSVLPSPVPGKENRIYRIPVGVVGVISAHNFPLFLAMKSVAPALALGNAVVLKPHQDAPVAGGTLIARIFEEAGLPPGVLNVVVTDIAEIGDAFIEHPVPRVLSFTGSDGVGRHVATVAARNFKRVVLEMGGNSALIVLDDADVDYAVDAAVFSRFVHQGQVCMAANRVLVDRSLQAEFTERFVARVRALKVGDPADPSTDLGPLISTRQAELVTEQVEAALAAGATALVRGAADGTLVSPTVLTGIAPGDPIARRELFGPVVVIIPFDGEDEAVKIANDTPFGLSGAVHTADTERGVRLAHRIDTGMIHVNDGTIADEPIVPFGGEKSSGVGRLNGEPTVEAFTTVKWISIQHGRTHFPL
ncbi:aldehyde dehydrogenase family protein [Streptomyces sp. NPDC051940]|uniref:aldehyde dehydrogenase family protein n=1 Tax=Streptomyces sp. NPDC051940 TaxID=3155675 RepID=UPI003421AA58